MRKKIFNDRVKMGVTPSLLYRLCVKNPLFQNETLNISYFLKFFVEISIGLCGSFRWCGEFGQSVHKGRWAHHH